MDSAAGYTDIAERADTPPHDRRAFAHMTTGLIFEATSKSADAPDIEPGLYDATFEGVTKKFIEDGQFGDGDRYEWNFTLLDDDGAVLYDGGDPLEVQGLTSMSFNPKSKTKPKALRYLSALMSAEEYATFTTGEVKISPDDLVGRKVQVDVAIRDSGWPTVVNVLPARKARRARPTASASAEADE
jgi:hypothetical protein